MKTPTKLTIAALLAVSAAAPAFAFEPESQIPVERSMSAVGQDQAYGAYAQAIAAPVLAVTPEAQLLAERNSYMSAVHTWAGTRRQQPSSASRACLAQMANRPPEPGGLFSIEAHQAHVRQNSAPHA